MATSEPIVANEITTGGVRDDGVSTSGPSTPMSRVASSPFQLTKLTMTYHPETIGLENLFIGIAGLVSAHLAATSSHTLRQSIVG
jgi:hypothetical protein